MQSDQAESIRAVAERIRQICDGMCGSRYMYLMDEARRLEVIARQADGPRRPGAPVTVANSRGSR